MDQELTLDLREIFHIIKKRLWIVVLITIATTVISGVLSFFIIPPVYEAKASIIIGKTMGEQNPNIQYNDVLMYQKLVKTYSEIAKSRLVAEKTATRIGNDITADEISNGVTITPQADTQIMIIKAQSKAPERAADIVNALSETFIEESKKLYPSGSVQIMDGAQMPKSPVKPRPMMNIAIAFFLGIMVSLGIIFLIEYMDNTIKTEDDIEKHLGLPVVGIIPKNIEG